MLAVVTQTIPQELLQASDPPGILGFFSLLFFMLIIFYWADRASGRRFWWPGRVSEVHPGHGATGATGPPAQSYTVDRSRCLCVYFLQMFRQCCGSLRFFIASCLQCQGCGGAAVRLNDHQGQQRLQSVFIITPFYFYFCTKREAVQTDRRPPQEHASIYSQPSLPLAPCALIGFQRLQPLPLSPPPLLTLTTPTSLKLSNPAAHADVAPPTLHQSCFSFVGFF